MGSRRRRIALWVGAGAALLLSIAAAAVVVFQRELVFPNAAEGPMDRPPPANAERVWFRAADGSRIEAWWFPAEARAAPAVLLLHGNSDYIETKIEYGDFYQREGISALLLEYRGYRRSQGNPTEAALQQDALAAYDWLARRPDVDAGRIVVHGASLGGAIAAATAAGRPARALILQGAFTSLPAMFRRFGVPGVLARDRFDTLAAVRAYGGPVLIFHGDKDEIVPYRHAQALAAAAGARGQLTLIAGADHDLPHDWASFGASILAFLRNHDIPAAHRPAEGP